MGEYLFAYEKIGKGFTNFLYFQLFEQVEAAEWAQVSMSALRFTALEDINASK